MARQVAAPVAVAVPVDVVAVARVQDAGPQAVAAVVDLVARAALLVDRVPVVDVAREAKAAARADAMVVVVAGKVVVPVRNASRAIW